MSAGGFQIGFTLDDKDFQRSLAGIVDDEIPGKILKAGRRAMALLLTDAIKVEPRAPHKTGTLWRSKSIDTPKKESDTFVVVGGFNVEYATEVHERIQPTNWTLEGSGPKYLESKMADYGLMRKYVQVIADAIRPGSDEGYGSPENLNWE